MINTEQQTKIGAYSGQRLVVDAVAGSGKTHSVELYVQANRDKRILYLVLVKAMRDEAIERFKNYNVTVSTIHSCAYRYVGRQFEHKLQPSITVYDIKEMLGTSSWQTAKLALKTLNAFLVSDEPIATLAHLDMDGIREDALDMSAEDVVSAVNDLFSNRMCDVNDPTRISHSGYLKLFQLSGIRLSQYYDVIIVDEAQDISPVTIAIIKDEPCKVILVGDQHQQIFRFAGANNSMKSQHFSSADRLELSESWRFGSAIAAVASKVLSIKGTPPVIIGRGGAGRVVAKPIEIATGCANIYRTVMWVIEVAIKASGMGYKVNWVGGIDSYNINDLVDFYQLKNGNTGEIRNTRIRNNYKSWDDVERIISNDADRELKRIADLLAAHPDILQITDTLVKCEATDIGDDTVIVSTAHRAKGLEFDNVLIGGDFFELSDRMTREELDDEINLLYVAVTRAKKALILNDLLVGVLQDTNKLKLIYTEASTK